MGQSDEQLTHAQQENEELKTRLDSLQESHDRFEQQHEDISEQLALEKSETDALRERVERLTAELEMQQAAAAESPSDDQEDEAENGADEPADAAAGSYDAVMQPEASSAEASDTDQTDSVPVLDADTLERLAEDQADDHEADDLKKIKGVGPKLEELLHGMGFFHYDQIANWTDAEVAWVDENLEGFKGRVSRDDWVEQAKTLAAGGSTEFSMKVDKGDVY